MKRNDPSSVSQKDGKAGWFRRIRPETWLLVAVGVYFVVSVTLSWARAVELQTTTWDQGLYQQALWSTSHGRPFYETADVETGGFDSLLQVHTVFLFYVLVPLYAAFPTELTLFVVQSAVVALAAVPLFYLARDISHSSGLGLAAGLIFLAWTPTLSSNLYDFHPEAFLPLEIFAVVLMWERQRFLVGFAVVAVAFLTIELAPVLLFFVGIFFLLPSWSAWKTWRSQGGNASRQGYVALTVRRALGRPRVQASLALLVASAFAFFVLADLRSGYLASALGTSPLPSAPTGYVIGGTPGSLGLAVGNLGLGLDQKLAYWLIIVALLGFVPLLAPRALVLSIPWFAFTLSSSNLNYVELGFQYGFVAATSLLVAFAYGLPHAISVGEAIGGWARRTTARLRGARESRPPRFSAHPTPFVLAAFAALVVVNVALSPVNPAMQNHGLGSAYRLSYSGVGEFPAVEELVSIIPAGATVVATDNLFPLVSNDVNAYSFSWIQDPLLALPFNASDPPQYVLVAEDRSYAVSPWIDGLVYNSSVFGVRAVDWSSVAGTILLFESGYRGPPSAYGTTPTFPAWYPGSYLVNSTAGYAASDVGGAYTTVAASAMGVLGTFFDGPDFSAPAGVLSITMFLRAAAAGSVAVPWAGLPVLSLTASAYGQPALVNETVDFGALAAPGWTSVDLNVSLGGPSFELSIRGMTLSTSVQLELGGIVVSQN